MPKPTRRGLALVVVLGVLALLSLLAVSFSTLTATERAVSRNYLDTVRARLAAQSGLEAALARLGELLDRGVLPTTDDWAPALAPLRVDGRELRPAGFLDTASYARRGDFYTLRITDANSRINVNDGAAWGPSHETSLNLARILNALGAQPTIAVPQLGDRLLAARPATGYAHRADLLRALGEDRGAFDRAADFLTVRAWSDPDVCIPIPLSSEAARSPGAGPGCGRPLGPEGPIYRYGHQRNADGEPSRAPLLFFDPANSDPFHHAVWGRDSLNPQWIEIVSRSPVNVNLARREVLVALLTDLEGVFLVERRRGLSERPDSAASPCLSPGGAYAWTRLRYSYDASSPDSGECGFLYRTLPFIGPGGRSRDGIPAEAVVDELLACRERRGAYATLPFGGPFRTWMQFHRFVDHLVETGLLAETRTELFFDLDERGVRSPSAVQLRVASQAIGDVLKANFNPNLHLNEINPDRTLFTHVDKTDLLVHSTEFCFPPMGTFEIESVGRIVRPRDGGDDAAAAENDAVAARTIVAQVRLFDARRESSQAAFARGAVSAKKAPVETNTNGALEVGPEPDNGPAPLESGYEGYLRLASVGSNFTRNERKPAGELRTTLSDPAWYPGATTSMSAGPHLGASMHAHFQLDHAAHHHASRNYGGTPPNWDGFRLPQGAWQTVTPRRACLNRNWEDRTETIPGPYGPVDTLRRPGRPDFRIARSFRGAPPETVEVAPSDLRVDGAYVERGSAFGYWMDENISFNFNEGAAAFWLKPAFLPEMTGKRRSLLSMSRVHAAERDQLNPSPFALFFVPPHAEGDGSPLSYAGGAGRFRPASLAFGIGFSTRTGYSWEMGGEPATAHASVHTPTLNHEGHGDGRESLLRGHEWTHVAVTWDLRRNRLPGADSFKILVNGRVVPGSLGQPHLYESPGQPFAETPPWSSHSQQALLPGLPGLRWCRNSVRLGGEPSMLFDGARLPGNFSADATFDEFYLWMDHAPVWNGGAWGIQALWNRGRFAVPDDRDPRDARFTSGPIDLTPPRRRSLPPPGASTDAARPVRILGAAWTVWTEGADREGPYMLDRSNAPARELRPEGGSFADLDVVVDGVPYGPLRDEGWSSVKDPEGRPPSAIDPSTVTYSVKLKAGGPASPGTILLASPVVDDVTIFFDGEGPRILSWSSP